MATIIRPSTPTPPSSIHTPQTPRLGTFQDDYQPYSPRKSTRVSSQQRARATHTPPRQTNNPQSSHRSSASTSTPRSPQTALKKQFPRNTLEMGGRRVPGALDFDSTASAAVALGLPTPTPRKSEKMDDSRANASSAGMLPTPAKTPKKRPDGTDPAVTAIARNLFAPRSDIMDEIMPSPRKKGRKKYSGFTLDSFSAEDESESIAIFTDSHERVPEADNSPENPFYGKGAEMSAEPVRRTSKRRKVSNLDEGEHDFDEVKHRDDGLVYVFRGRRSFRKFSQITAGDSGSLNHGDGTEDDLLADAGDEELEATLPNHQRRITRSSIQPRLLFPSPQQIKAKERRMKATEEEEADTDIEVPPVIASSSRARTTKKTRMTSINSTPMDHYNVEITTPKAPRFAPASPPTTIRTTRSQKFSMDTPPTGSEDEDPETPINGGGVSPFHGWQRVKIDDVKGSKRGGESLAASRGSKRARN